MQGFIKLHRKLLGNPICLKDSDHLAIWIYLLLSATHTEIDVLYGGERITLKAGQLLTGRKSIAKNLKISESKVQRILKFFEIEHQIEQRTNFQQRLITIVNWNEYQQSEQRIEQRVNSDRTASEQRVNTNKNIKKDKNVKNVKKEELPEGNTSVMTAFGNPQINELIAYFKQQLGATLDQTDKTNRQYCYNLIRKMQKDYPDKNPTILIKQLVDMALNDEFHSKNATSFKYLFYNAQKIIATIKMKKKNNIAVI